MNGIKNKAINNDISIKNIKYIFNFIYSNLLLLLLIMYKKNFIILYN